MYTQCAVTVPRFWSVPPAAEISVKGNNATKVKDATHTSSSLALWCPLLPAIRHPVPDWVKPSFVIFDIRALWRSALNVRVPRCQKLRFNPVWHRMLYSCTHMATVAVKGLESKATCQAVHFWGIQLPLCQLQPPQPSVSSRCQQVATTITWQTRPPNISLTITLTNSEFCCTTGAQQPNY